MAADGDILKALRTAAKGLLFPSESDKPLKAFVWKNAAGATPAKPTEAAVKTAAEATDGAKVETVSVDDFFAPVTEAKPWFGEEEKEQLDKFQALVKLLKEQLTDAQVFRVQEPDATTVTAYAVGVSNKGELAGVQTQLVET